MPGERGPDDGFTLVEVLVALAVIGIALAFHLRRDRDPALGRLRRVVVKPCAPSPVAADLTWTVRAGTGVCSTSYRIEPGYLPRPAATA